MAVLTGKVVDGVVVVEGHLLQEGIKVTILIDDDVDVPFHLTAEMQAELEQSIAQADRGETIPAAQVLEELRAKTRAFQARISS